MAHRDEILAYLSDYLRVPQFPDYGPQGLQVEGRENVEHVVTGVSACQELFVRAVNAGADMVMAHHGILWDFDTRVVAGAFRERLKMLLDHGVTRAAYHLCLDAHEEVGNNHAAARGLGLTDLQPFVEVAGQPIGVRGRWDPPRETNAAFEAIGEFYDTDPFAFFEGPAMVEHVGLCSGGAQKEVGRAVAEGLDMYITGEVSEFVMHVAREGHIHFVAAGHHATERIGIRTLGDHVAEKFAIQHTFIDIENPV